MGLKYDPISTLTTSYKPSLSNKNSDFVKHLRRIKFLELDVEVSYPKFVDGVSVAGISRRVLMS